MKLIQFYQTSGKRCVGIPDQDRVWVLDEVSTTYELFFYAENNHIEITEAVDRLAGKHYESYSILADKKKILVPLDHPDPYHTWITGTGLTHWGSAASRNAMHEKPNILKEQELTDSMKMFRMGAENGKMKDQIPGTQPEWFYKGNGLVVTHPYQPLLSPSFAFDGGEEPEIAGLYIVDTQGRPRRIGFALGNEFSDHKMERINYLYLAHSKLRPCSFGPELLPGDLPQHITGKSRILRNQKILWEKEFLTGEKNMSHNIANLEYHHFKYDLFRQPGDVHIHFFGTSLISYTDHIETQHGDIFEIEADCFDQALWNDLAIKSA